MNKKERNVAIVPPKYRKISDIGAIDLTKLIWQTGTDADPSKTINDLGEDDHIVIYPCSNILFSNYSHLRCKVSLIMFEPYAIHGKYYKLLWLIRRKFHKVFVRYTALSNKYGNVVDMVLADSWITTSLTNISFNKNKMISLIASEKQKFSGQKLRHEAVTQIQKLQISNVECIGGAYKPFKQKEEGLAPYRFSIIIENAKEDDYFTEKLIDCLLCKTIPIYWGASNIGDYFDINGFIQFNCVSDLVNIIQNLSKEDYQNSVQAIEKNHITANLTCWNNDKTITYLQNTN
jgi:hypothetical protein